MADVYFEAFEARNFVKYI